MYKTLNEQNQIYVLYTAINGISLNIKIDIK